VDKDVGEEPRNVFTGDPRDRRVAIAALSALHFQIYDPMRKTDQSYLQGIEIMKGTSVYSADAMRMLRVAKDLFCSLSREACVRYVYARR
jgi:hypothetical protein